METFAYLHLAQDYEDPECKEFSISQRWLDGLNQLQFSRTSAIALLGLLSTVWASSLAETASANSYIAGSDPIFVNSSAPSAQFVLIRVDGDRAVIQPNPCRGNGSVVTVRPVEPDFRPVRPDPDFRPVRPSGDVFLRRGDVGPDVRYVQDLLRSVGYFDATSTGFYATLTEAGVRAFQIDNGLGVDGIVGPQTLALLERRA